MLLPDINVWLAVAFQSHDHHPAAKKWFDGLSNDHCFFCRITQQGFLRLATNRAVFKEFALKLPEAWEKYDVYLSDPRISFAEEPDLTEQHWRIFTQRQSYSHNVWGDAYLAAFAFAGKMELVTFDEGFRKFPNLKCTILV
jgi:uncharacterized protein